MSRRSSCLDVFFLFGFFRVDDPELPHHLIGQLNVEGLYSLIAVEWTYSSSDPKEFRIEIFKAIGTTGMSMVLSKRTMTPI